MIERRDIEKLAKLARIKVSEAEAEAYRGEFDAILGYVGELQKVSIPADISIQSESVKNVLREDGAPHEGGVHTEALLKEAPKSSGGYVQVKKIL